MSKKKAPAKYSEMVKAPIPATWSANHIPDYYQSQKRHGIHKKCLCCGKIYPANTNQRNCDCKAHGHLYAAGYLHSERGGRAVEAKESS